MFEILMLSSLVLIVISQQLPAEKKSVAEQKEEKSGKESQQSCQRIAKVFQPIQQQPRRKYFDRAA